MKNGQNNPADQVLPIYSNKLPKRSLSSFKISELEALDSEICRFLYVAFTVFLKLLTKDSRRTSNHWEDFSTT